MLPEDLAMPTVNFTFASVSALRQWLKKRNEEAGNPEAYYEWLQSFFEEGNTITVHGEEYDYWACWELL